MVHLKVIDNAIRQNKNLFKSIMNVLIVRKSHWLHLDIKMRFEVKVNDKCNNTSQKLNQINTQSSNCKEKVTGWF